jgi:hypothetical protein
VRRELVKRGCVTPTRCGIAFAASTICIACVVAMSAAAARAAGIIGFSTAPAAPRSAKASFVHNLLGGVPEGHTVQVAKLRRIGVEAFPGETERLFVAPLSGGGFCYEWAYEIGASSWLAELSGCSVPRAKLPLSSSHDDTRISIVASRSLVEGVSVKLSDGSVAEPALLWVSDPIGAGFWLYQPPAGVHVVEVDALQHGKVVARNPITAQG